MVAVVALSASRVAGHKSDPETVIAFMQYFTLISMAMMSVTRIFVMYTKSAASAKRIGEVLDMPEDLTVKSEDEYPCKNDDGYIVFEHVRFSYKGAHDDLADVSFSVPRGGSLGIIGATGSGKSTLGKAASALLRSRGGQHPHRRTGYPNDSARAALSDVRHGDAERFSLCRYD